jgi:AraC-like DNA-binding protein
MIRRLRFLGTSYQEITSEFLQARAREMLANDEVTIKEIAGTLGFDSPANFGRTFKRWFGISPGAYRDTRLLNHAPALAPDRLRASARRSPAARSKSGSKARPRRSRRA